MPICGALGALAKETFVPYSIVFAIAWWLSPRRRERRNPAETSAPLSTRLAACLAFAALESALSGHMVLPWQFGVSLRASGGHLDALRANILDRNLLYGFVWLLPIGILRLKQLPRPWIVACAATAVAAFALVAWYGAMPGTAARALFSIAGPLLTISASVYLSGVQNNPTPVTGSGL